MKSELLMNPSEHFHDNRHNNFSVFTSQMLGTKYKYSISILIAYIITTTTMDCDQTRLRAAIKLTPYLIF